MGNRKTLILRIVAAVVILSLFVVLGRIFSASIKKELESQITESLEDVSYQNAITIEKEIEAKQKLLESMAKDVHLYGIDNREEIFHMFAALIEVYEFKRIGIIYPNGMSYSSDGFVTDLSFRDFFVEGMQGRPHVSEALEDTITNDDLINVFSVPIFDENDKVIGVLYASYKNEMFEQLLSVDSFGGEGYGMVIQADGTVIVNSKKSPTYGSDNVFSNLESTEGVSKANVEQIRNDMKNGEDGHHIYTNGEERYVYYMPLNLDNMSERWYVHTVVPATVLAERTDRVMLTVEILMVIMILAIVLAVGAYFYIINRSKKSLIKLAYEDPLTEGDNFVCFKEKIKSKKDALGFVISMDISDFKIINNTCGTETGNKTICYIHNVLRRNLRSDELLGHINADRFIVYMIEKEEATVIERIEKITEELTAISGELNIPRVVPYFGIYKYDCKEDIDTAYSHANQAKNLMKGRRDKNYGFYNEVDYKQLLKNRALADKFEEAIKNYRFEVWYQPKYTTEDSTVDGAEALVRWREEDGKLIPPFEFIPLFEKNGMISELDAYVFDTVCRQQTQWLQEGKNVYPVSVNISRVSLYYPNIVERYLDILEKYQLPSEYVQLEITESAIHDNEEIKNLINQFRDAGFKMLLDDFGAGYSSLSTLSIAHFDVLKIDKGMIDHIGDANGEKLLYYIIELAKSMGLMITAEGVESENQVEFLRRLQCTNIQGYFFSKPLPKVNYETLVYRM